MAVMHKKECRQQYLLLAGHSFDYCILYQVILDCLMILHYVSIFLTIGCFSKSTNILNINGLNSLARFWLVE